jgi:hypothetical protein
MSDELERIWKDAVVTYIKTLPEILLEGLSKTMTDLCHDKL